MYWRSAALVAALFAGMSVVENGAVSSRPSQARSERLSSVAALAGEFRTVAANLLWIKADRYHHEFAERNPDWTQDTDLLGLLHMITDLDPRFEEAYSSGAIIYAYGSERPKRAIAYLSEGISHNPRSWDLHRVAAIIYARRLRDPARALVHARAAVTYCDSDSDKPIMRRLLRTIRRMADDQATRSPPHRSPG